MTLAELRVRLANLTGQATAKRAELKDDTSEVDAKRIEAEHAALLTEVESVRAQIATAEAAEVTRAQQVTAPTIAPTVIDQAAVDRAAAQAIAGERTRSAEVRTLARHFGVEAFGEEHVTSGTDLAAFRSKLIDKLAETNTRGPTNGNVQITQDETVTRREQVEDYLVARASSKPAPEKSHEYRGMRLIDIARECLSWEGVSTRSMTPNEIAKRGLHSTSDFPLILANVANKMLLAGYAARPQTFRPWTQQMSLSDFKALSMLRLGNNPGLKLVNEHGEFKRGTIAEGKETISLKTYGIVVGITRQVIVNDDLGAFTSIPSKFGQSASSLESDLVWGKLMANPVLVTDSKPVFNQASHSNNPAVGAAPSTTTISAGRVAMSKQMDLDATTVLNLTPSFILAPPSLEMTIAQLLVTIQAAQSSNVVPEYVRSLTPIIEPRLEVGISNTDIGVNVSGSAGSWYLAVGAGADTIIFAYLDGQTGPFTESRVGFDVDGVEIKCRHDFGVAAADYRGLYKNNGA